MTIQNIEDVMDRIMSLNRNLTEYSLRTLLSASGWDKDDIVEGLRIFKLRAVSSHSFSSTPLVAPAYGPEVNHEDNYSFNIKKEEKPAPTPPPIVPAPKVEDNSIKVITSSLPEEPKKVEPEIPVIDKDIEDNPKKSTAAKIFSVILILILTALTIAYFFPATFGNFMNAIFVKNNKPQVAPPITNVVQATSSIDNPRSTDNTIASSTSLATLLQEISNLRNELNSYKAASQSSKTIVKYISQRGPTGKAGRGIGSISATSTGFVINYTDDTSIIIPYSTSTIINILNSNSVCFRDVTSSSTQVAADVCLDRNAVSKLIASSTASQ